MNSTNKPNLPTHPQIESSLTEGATRYFEECRQRIPLFTKTHFAYPGCWQTNKTAIGWDMVRTPLNLFWAPIYLVLQLIAWLLPKAGWHRTARFLSKAPTGFTTRVQRHIAELIYTELLQRAHNNEKPDRFKESIISALEEKLEITTKSPVDHNEIFEKFEKLVQETLEQYNMTRTASSDIANAASSTILGAFAFKKFTPGGMGLGILSAAYIAKEQAEQNFFLGETLGGVYYHLFPPEPSLSLVLGSTAAVLTVLAFFAAISGLITDPFQYYSRLHHLRLKKVINNLEKDFLEKTQSRFKPKDQYIARVLDIFDTIKSQII